MGNAHQPRILILGIGNVLWADEGFGVRAAEEMARLKGETALAARYHAIFESGKAWMNERMWNGEYYVHLYPFGFHNPRGSNGARDVITPQQDQMNARDYIDAMLSGKPHYYVSTACDAQQTFGQNWAHQLGLGYILPAEHCRTAALGGHVELPGDTDVRPDGADLEPTVADGVVKFEQDRCGVGRFPLSQHAVGGVRCAVRSGDPGHG